MRVETIQKTYARWAPIYDATFGAITNGSRVHATNFVNTQGGSVLEVGIGTGIALTRYSKSISITGVDLSVEMLRKAQDKVARLKLKNVTELVQMDAQNLQYADETFDHVVAMHVMSVVPKPELVLAEMARVCRIGGSIMIGSHLARQNSSWSTVEKLFAPLADVLGWHSDFERARLMGDARLCLEEQTQVPPLSLMTYMRFRRIA